MGTRFICVACACVLMVGCGGDNGGRADSPGASNESPSSAESESPEAPVVAEGTLEVTAGAGNLTVPTTDVAAGDLDITFVNDDALRHELVVTRLPASPPIHELAKEPAKAITKAAEPLGKIKPLPSGASGELSVTLEPGAYGLFCLVAADAGRTHAYYGMWRQIDVV